MIETLQQFREYLQSKGLRVQNKSCYATHEGFYCSISGNSEEALPHVTQVFSTPDGFASIFIVRLSFKDCQNEKILNAT